jgi:hypothetical protein
MKIGMYKIGKKIIFGDEHDDKNCYAHEFITLAKIFVKFGHEVVILSEVEFCKDFGIRKATSLENFDIIYFLSGGLEDNLFFTFTNLRQRSRRIGFIITDLRCTLEDRFYQFVDKVFTQSNFNISDIKAMQGYNGMPQSIFFEEDQYSFYNNVIQDKTKEIVFGGTERNRTQHFCEYVYRPNVEFYGKSDTFNLKDNRVGFNEFAKVLRGAKYSIIIADDYYYENGFVTQRYCDCILNDVIPLVDENYDFGEIFINKYDYRRVANFTDVIEKINTFNKNDNIRIDILFKQKEKIPKSAFTGELTIGCLMDWR